jgi:nucleoside-diphosphate-sugar epimerase
MKKALVLGAGGFIGNHMVKKLIKEGYWVRGVDFKYPEFDKTEANEFVVGDLRENSFVEKVIRFKGIDINFYDYLSENEVDVFDEVYQFAADMGGAGFVFSGNNDSEIMHNSGLINLNVLESIKSLNDNKKKRVTKIFYSSSACIYPEFNQLDPDNPDTREETAYPANPDSEYGWEKLFSERLYLSYFRNHGIDIRIARYHNIYGPLGSWDGGREKAPAAICRKIAQLQGSAGEIEVWGDGNQTRSFLYIDDCIEATFRLMQSNFIGPVNIGSEEMVSINKLVEIVSEISGKKISKRHKLDAPLGVRGRNSNNDLVRKKLNWDYKFSLKEGLGITYDWILSQVNKKNISTNKNY